MGFETGWVNHGGRRAYVSRPARATSPLPAVLVLQEIWGVDAHIQDVTRRFAKAGYVAVAPDLYAVDGERPAQLGEARVAEVQAFLNALPPTAWGDPGLREAALSTRPQEERRRIGECLGALFASLTPTGLRLDHHLPGLLATTSFLRDTFGPTRGAKVGAVGFCMGGGLAGLLACHDPGLAASVVFYGGAPPDELLGRLSCPMLAFHGSLDARLAPTAPVLADKLRRLGKRYEPHVYAGVQHAFFNDGRPSYDVRASRDAFARTLSFLCEQLG